MPKKQAYILQRTHAKRARLHSHVLQKSQSNKNYRSTTAACRIDTVRRLVWSGKHRSFAREFSRLPFSAAIAKKIANFLKRTKAVQAAQ
jgi:hypothetical protein